MKNEGYLLIKHRNTMRNFTKMANKSRYENNEEPINTNMLTTQRKLITIDYSKTKAQEKVKRIPKFKVVK